MNQTIHFMGIPTFSLKIVIFNQKLLMDITKPKGKSLWLNSPKKRKIPSWQVGNKPFQLAAIICGKWEFWQIYAQWRLIVGDKCWFLQLPISDHPMPPLLWTTAKCPLQLFSSVLVLHGVLGSVLVLHSVLGSVLVLHSVLGRVGPPGVPRQPLPPGGLRPGKHSKF